MPIEHSTDNRGNNLILSIKNKALAAFTLFSVISMPILAADNQLTAEEKSAGWQLLFNGKDISQWRTFKEPKVNAKWTVEDGAIALTAGGGGDLISQQSYKNFELTLDWKIAEVGNSGILILADEKGKYIYSHAPEIQILDNERHPDNKLATHLSGSLYDMIASPAQSHKKAGEWNTTKIRLENATLTVWQNAVQTAKVTIGSDEWNSLVAKSKFADWPGFAKANEGHIGLQDHGDKVWFKNIKIKELN